MSAPHNSEDNTWLFRSVIRRFDVAAPHEDEQLVAGIDDDCVSQMAPFAPSPRTQKLNRFEAQVRLKQRVLSRVPTPRGGNSNGKATVASPKTGGAPRSAQDQRAVALTKAGHVIAGVWAP